MSVVGAPPPPPPRLRRHGSELLRARRSGCTSSLAVPSNAPQVPTVAAVVNWYQYTLNPQAHQRPPTRRRSRHVRQPRDRCVAGLARPAGRRGVHLRRWRHRGGGRGLGRPLGPVEHREPIHRAGVRSGGAYKLERFAGGGRAADATEAKGHKYRWKDGEGQAQRKQGYLEGRRTTHGTEDEHMYSVYSDTDDDQELAITKVAACSRPRVGHNQQHAAHEDEQCRGEGQHGLHPPQPSAQLVVAGGHGEARARKRPHKDKE